MNRSKIFKLSYILLLLVFVTSCVSKKKFLEMQDNKVRAERRVATLTDVVENKEGIIDSLYSEYNKMKNELLSNNSIKDAYADSLARQMVALKNNVTETNANLEEKIFAFKYEKRRYLDSIKALEKKNESLKKQSEKLGEKVKSMEEILTNVRFESKKHLEEKNRLNSQLVTSKNEMKGQLNVQKNLEQQIATLKKKIADKDQQIKRLTNNVKLLKDNLGKK